MSQSACAHLVTLSSFNVISKLFTTLSQCTYPHLSFTPKDPLEIKINHSLVGWLTSPCFLLILPSIQNSTRKYFSVSVPSSQISPSSLASTILISIFTIVDILNPSYKVPLHSNHHIEPIEQQEVHRGYLLPWPSILFTIDLLFVACKGFWLQTIPC